MNKDELMELLADFLIRCEEKGLITINREPIKEVNILKPAGIILDIIISGLVREDILEEMRNGKIVEYHMLGGEKIISKQEIERIIIDTIHKIVERISERSI